MNLSSEHGMELFARLDTITIKKEVVTTDDVVTSWCGGKQNRFQLQDSSERDIFFGYEDPSLCCPQVVCGRSRPSDVVITAGQEVLRLSRPLRCPTFCCCFPVCMQQLEVHTSGGTLLGRVVKEVTLCTPSFLLTDSTGAATLRVYREAWCHPCRINEGEEFTISWADGGPEVGSLSCLWLEDQFCLTFPPSLDTATKATLLGAFFLIDFNYY